MRLADELLRWEAAFMGILWEIKDRTDNLCPEGGPKFVDKSLRRRQEKTQKNALAIVTARAFYG